MVLKGGNPSIQPQARTQNPGLGLSPGSSDSRAEKVQVKRSMTPQSWTPRGWGCGWGRWAHRHPPLTCIGSIITSEFMGTCGMTETVRDRQPRRSIKASCLSPMPALPLSPRADCLPSAQSSGSSKGYYLRRGVLLPVPHCPHHLPTPHSKSVPLSSLWNTYKTLRSCPSVQNLPWLPAARMKAELLKLTVQT